LTNHDFITIVNRLSYAILPKLDSLYIVPIESIVISIKRF